MVSVREMQLSKLQEFITEVSPLTFPWKNLKDHIEVYFRLSSFQCQLVVFKKKKKQNNDMLL